MAANALVEGANPTLACIPFRIENEIVLILLLRLHLYGQCRVGIELLRDDRHSHFARHLDQSGPRVPDILLLEALNLHTTLSHGNTSLVIDSILTISNRALRRRSVRCN